MTQLNLLDNKARIFAPDSNFIKNANLSKKDYIKLTEKATTNYTGFWGDLASEHINWQYIFDTVLDETKAPFYTWFNGGKLNVSYNCLDRHVAKTPCKIAIISESDSGNITKVTYSELLELVCRFANGLKSLGVKEGDRVILYMPHSIEAIIAMQACARIGAIHSVVFGGFSSKSLAERIADAGATCLITANGQIRGGKSILLKKEVDAALEILGDRSTIKNVVVNCKADIKCEINPSLDIWWDELIKGKSSDCEPVGFDSEHPLFILYTSGSTGSPKGVQHASAGYLLGAIVTMKWVFDIKADDIFWCTADVGWITGHTYVCYGPLAVGATQLIFEGVPTYPDASRFWRMIERYKVSIFYTAPTAIRTLIKLGSDLPGQFDLSSLRLLGSVGEPINPEAWMWYYEVVGKSKCPIVDTWWQTETGCHMLSPIPGIDNIKPGSCAFPIPGVMADIIDKSGRSIDNLEESGYLVIKRPFPSQIRTIWNNNERFIQSYFPEDIAGGKYYVAGDSASLDLDKYFWILGRIDDVLNVSGHRLGSAEIESAIVSHPRIAEAAVVGKPDAIKGELIFAFVVCKGSVVPSTIEAMELKSQLREWVSHEIGAIAKPDEIRFSDNLPKTRSGKIMRRLLRSIARGEEITGDISTLENPAILEQLRQQSY